MDPLIAGAAVAAAAQVVSGVMQHYQSEKARKATKQRLAEIERMFDAIVPPDLNLKIWDDPRLVATIPEPHFNLEKITPEQYESVGQYIPQVAEYAREARPELVVASQEATKGRQAQMDALERYKEIARSDFDPQFQQAVAAASRKARGDAQSRSATLLQDAQRRGQGGSLATMAAQQAGGADDMQRSAVEGQMAAAESYRNKLAALGQSANLGGQIRQSEMSEAGRNADIINSFNERTARNYQQYANQRAAMANEATQYNLGQRQRIADANVGQRNDAEKEWLARNNTLAQRQYENQRQTRDDRLAIEKYKNSLKQQQYENEMGKARGKAGISQTAIDYLRQNAQDTNQAIRGVGDTVSTGAMLYGAYGQRQAQQPPAPKPGEAGYDYGSTPGNYRRLDDEYWRTS